MKELVGLNDNADTATAAEGIFDRLDADNDGLLSDQEVLAILRKQTPARAHTSALSTKH